MSAKTSLIDGVRVIYPTTGAQAGREPASGDKPSPDALKHLPMECSSVVINPEASDDSVPDLYIFSTNTCELYDDKVSTSDDFKALVKAGRRIVCPINKSAIDTMTLSQVCSVLKAFLPLVAHIKSAYKTVEDKEGTVRGCISPDAVYDLDTIMLSPLVDWADTGILVDTDSDTVETTTDNKE